MKNKEIPAIVIIVVLLSFFGVIAFAAQDRFELKAPNGVAFSEIRGYETWQVIAPSYDNDDLKVILGNPLMINAYKEGIPGNGKPFPEGSVIHSDRARHPRLGSAHCEGFREIPRHEWVGIWQVFVRCSV